MLQCHAEVFGVGFFVLALGAIRQRHFLRAGILLALALGGRWSLLPPLLMIVVFAKAELTARRNLILGSSLGVLSFAFLFGAMGPFNSDGLEALYRELDTQSHHMEVVCCDAVDDLGAWFGRSAPGLSPSLAR